MTMPIVYAHRGASAYAPENTLPAFQMALDMHADGIETDIRYTKDGVCVLNHDGVIDRISNGKGAIDQMTYAELKQYDYSASFNTYAGTSIATADELLAMVAGMKRINIEVKTMVHEGEDRIRSFTQLLERAAFYGCEDRLIFSSFDHPLLRFLKEHFPTIRTGLLYSAKLTPDETLEMVHTYNADAIHPDYIHLDEAICQACQAEGIEVNAWTINSPEAIARVIELHTTGIITDVPDKVLAALGR